MPASNPASWIRRWRRARRDTDWADLGTAFGLERSLEQASAPQAASAEATGPGTGAPPRTWWQRWGRRSAVRRA
ncbi:MAG: hypothetical protein JNJ71_08845 [Rubrivivax sp.]|nr:hypothetical protein [Rubrivivax sp.]